MSTSPCDLSDSRWRFVNLTLTHLGNRRLANSGWSIEGVSECLYSYVHSWTDCVTMRTIHMK